MRLLSFEFAHAVLRCAGAMALIGCSTTHSEPTSPASRGRPKQLRVSAFTLDGGAMPAAYAVRRHGLSVDSVRLDAGTAILSATTADTMLLTVAPERSDQYYASVGTLIIGGDTSVDVVLIPTSWTVHGGRYAGAKRAIDIIKALGSDADDTHFLDYFTPARGMFFGWAEADLPIRVGYDTTGSKRRWTASDSAWFWSSLTDINDAMGRTIFEPMTNVPLSAHGVIGVRVDYADPTTRQGVLGADLDACKLPLRGCDAAHGTVILGYPVFVRSVFDKENFRVMQHEVMHALGFGHACYWPSVMMHTGVDCAPTVPNDISVDDAAYIELALRLATMLEAHPYAWNLDEALSGARIRGTT